MHERRDNIFQRLTPLSTAWGEDESVEDGDEDRDTHDDEDGDEYIDEERHRRLRNDREMRTIWSRRSTGHTPLRQRRRY